MTISPQIAWIVPVIIPALMGLLVGVIMRHSVRLVFVVAALAVLLVLTGYISLTFQELFDQAMKFLPRIIGTGIGIVDVLPYSTATFLIGLGLGLWKG